MKITCQQRFSKLNGPSTRVSTYSWLCREKLKNSAVTHSSTLCREFCSTLLYLLAFFETVKNLTLSYSMNSWLEKPGQGNNAEMPRKFMILKHATFLGDFLQDRFFVNMNLNTEVIRIASFIELINIIFFAFGICFLFITENCTKCKWFHFC